MADIDLGAIVVDTFFVSIRKWVFALNDYFSKRFCRVHPLFALTSFVIADYRYFVFWTLPLEVAYYFFIPLLVIGILALRRFWFLPFFPAHMELRPHFPTFLAESLYAYTTVAVFLSLIFHSLFFHWMIVPSCVSRIFEWDPNDKVFSRLALVLLLSTIFDHVVEYPLQLQSQQTTKGLEEQEKKGSGGVTTCHPSVAHKIRSRSTTLAKSKPRESKA
ncbi:uncharacterized protein PITG_16728 [Phytophthora infestans T30-4]|uniref:Transmembrane protein n=1 Tax=Phytophthora infestans (strain T30-4) TaxID=403677 RepID=D0NVH1_PHYIT|nr:uncharacterized protein PITG_16728 [Phytophthora infestans T30-4]EEY66648.1 conserved hypothetical protein [Phytophthora infestans T30-4]|eukprot:XP_002896949.1 conserved hypothetical protein [Phytophthora infestans T30-4]